VFIADGTGIAPIRPMIRRALATATGRPVGLLHAASSGTALVYGAEHARLARENAGFQFEHVPSATLHAEVVRRWVDADRDRTRRFFVCGVGAIVPALRDVLRGAGYERRAVQYEKW
jgi:ferredoxin-NADP reductase